MQLDEDDRLVAAVGGVARYLADAAGLSSDLIVEFETAVLAACKHCLHGYRLSAPCGVTLRRSLDRLEVEITLPGLELPTGQPPSWQGIDELRSDREQGGTRVHLTKFVPPNPPAD